MKLPTFSDFKANERTVYAYLILMAVGALFFMLRNNYENQLKECSKERIDLSVKIDTLNNKLIRVITKQNEILTK